MGLIRAAVFPLLLLSTAALPCTDIVPAPEYAKTRMAEATVVFRGTVIERTALPERSDMAAKRYAVKFRVNEYWKGSPASTLILYEAVTLLYNPCSWSRQPKPGGVYLVYALEKRATDEIMSDQDRQILPSLLPSSLPRDTTFRLWYGWTDIMPEGTAMLVEIFGGGEVSDLNVQRCIKVLGTGQTPAGEAKR